MSPGILQRDEQDRYQTFLLRLWRGRYHGTWLWRASLESPRTGERQLFASLEQLFAFLSERCARQAPYEPDEQAARGGRPQKEVAARPDNDECDRAE